MCRTHAHTHTHAALNGAIFRNRPVDMTCDSLSHEIQREKKGWILAFMELSCTEKLFQIGGDHILSTSLTTVKMNTITANWDLFPINVVLRSPLCLQDNVFGKSSLLSDQISNELSLSLWCGGINWIFQTSAKLQIVKIWNSLKRKKKHKNSFWWWLSPFLIFFSSARRNNLWKERSRSFCALVA